MLVTMDSGEGLSSWCSTDIETETLSLQTLSPHRIKFMLIDFFMTPCILAADTYLGFVIAHYNFFF